MKAISQFVSDSVRRLWRGSSPLVRATVLALILVVLALLPGATTAAQPGTPETLLRTALHRARQAGSYQVDLDIQQTVSLEQAGPIAMGLPRNESAHFIVAGYVGGLQKARFIIEPRRISRGLQLNGPATAQEILIAGGTLYEREGDRWVKNDDVTPLPGVNADALSLLSVARDVHRLEPVERLTGRYERVGFALHSSDVLRHLLSQRGQVDEFALALAEAGQLALEKRSLDVGDLLRDAQVNFGPQAADRGVTLALENGSPEILKCAISDVDVFYGERGLGISVDVGHANMLRGSYESPVVEILDMFSERLVHLHLADNFGEKDDHLTPGDGTIDWESVASKLLAMGFDGSAAFEINSKSARENALRGREFLEGLIGQMDG